MTQVVKVKKTPPAPVEDLKPDRIYTYEEAGQFLRMSEKQMKRRVAAGHIGDVQMGRGRKISGRQILAYIERASEPPLRGRRKLE